MSRNCWSCALSNESLNLVYHDWRNWLLCWTDICFSKGFSTEARQTENNYCNNGKTGKGKSHVNIKKSYEKNTTEVQDSDNFTEILQEIMSPLKNVKVKVVNNKHITHLQKHHTLRKTCFLLILFFWKSKQYSNFFQQDNDHTSCADRTLMYHLLYITN